MIAIDARAVHQNPFGLGRYVKNLVRGLTLVDPGGSYLLFSTGPMPFPLPPGFLQQRVTKRRIVAEQIEMPLRAARRSIALTHYTANHAPLVAATPTVLTIHDHLFLRHWRDISARSYLTQRLGATYRRWTIPGAAARANAIIAVSEYARRELQKVLNLPSEKITVILEAVDPAFERPPAGSQVQRVRERLDVRRPYVFALGNFDRRKNVGHLLRAFARLLENPRFDADLVLAGAINLWATDYRQIVEGLRLSSRVRFLPLVTDAELAALYAGAALFVYPSSEEGFGLPILEAMSCGCPIVTNRAAAIPEVAEEAVEYADPLNLEDFSKAILRVATNPEIAGRLRKRGLERAKLFSWERAAQQTLAVYRQQGGL